MTTRYRDDADFRLLSGMLDGLAFLPVSDVPAGMAFIRRIMPPTAQPLIDYFDVTYVSGSESSGTHRRPRFPPSVWNVHEITVNNSDRTNNFAEAWNRAFETLLGESHPSVWTCIQLLQADAAQTASILMKHANGTLGRQRRRLGVQQMQRRLHHLCTQYDDGERQIEEFLRAVGHNIRFKH